MPAEPAKVRIEVGTYGLKSLEVNGQDWTANVAGVQLGVGKDSVPTVTVALTPEPFVFEGEGVVVVETTSPADEGKIIEKFLDQLDPGIIDEMALENLGFGESSTSSVFQVLKDIANAR